MTALRPRRKATTPKNADEVVQGLFPTHDPFTFDANSDQGIFPFTEAELTLAAKKLKGGKAPGPDGIPAEMIKLSVTADATAIANVMNTCLQRGVFPVQWKKGTLRLIPKEGHTELTPKYRPICLLNAAGKLLEQLLNKRLVENLDSTMEYQHGNTPTVQTSHAQLLQNPS